MLTVMLSGNTVCVVRVCDVVDGVHLCVVKIDNKIIRTVKMYI